MAVKTDVQLLADANVIKAETAPGANSATRVGDMLINMIDSKPNVDEVVDATASVKGISKLYVNLAASNTDGSVHQSAIVAGLALKENITNYSFVTTSGGGTQLAVTLARTANKTTRYEVSMVARRLTGPDPAGSSCSQSIVRKVVDIAGVGTLGSLTALDTDTDSANVPTVSMAVSGANTLINVTPGSGHTHDCTFRVKTLEA